MEDDPGSPQVACLFNIVDLQKVCQKESVKLSDETNRYMLYLTLRKLGPILAQKLIKKLVDRGEIEWDKEEDFEVEAILNYHKEEETGKEFYLIKWKNWSHEHNSWEPREHLGCEDLLEQYSKQYSGNQDPVQQRPPAVYNIGDQKTSHQKIDELMKRILKTVEITPLKLLNASQSPVKHGSSRLAGIATNGPRSRRLKKPVSRNINNKRTKAYKELKAEIQLALKAWETKLNQINSDPAPIMVENKVDLEGPPENFTYINDYQAMPGVDIPDDPIVGCECEECFEEKKTCCSANAGAVYGYYKNSRVRVPPGHPIYECNKRCHCPPSCPNRVVQHGRKHKVCVFRTSNGRGWGVKAMQKIKKGSFVMEYVGEVITNEEAEKRGKVYDAEGRTYLFDLDYNDADCPYTVDAGFFGNVSHFVNHCCDPNLAVYGVWINHLDPRLPRIALFAKRDINKGDELTFDYLMTGDTTTASVEIPDTPEEATMDTTDSSFENNGSQSDEAGKGPLDNNNSQSVPAKCPVPASQSPQENDQSGLGNVFKVPLAIDVASPASTEAQSVTNSDQISVSDNQSDVTGSRAESEMDTDSVMDEEMEGLNQNPFSRRKITSSPSNATKYRLMCQCEAKNCRKYLY